MFDPTILFVASLAFLLAGGIKGAAGLGLPTAAIAGMTLVLEPRVAIAIVLFPMLVLNFWQWVSAGDLMRSARQYFPFAGILFVFVAITTFVSKNVAEHQLMLALGGVIILFVVVSWSGKLPKLTAKQDLPAQIGFGIFAGIIGGMTSAWAAPMGMYLNMAQVDKDEFIRASGFMITIGSLPLCLAYAQLGFLTGPLALTSLMMIVPAMIGFGVGAAIRNRLSQVIFRHVVLVVFLVLALNLIRRAVWAT
ncbi:sulfite exporter TauE/SafE family protein [Amylibacter sp.]|nr:sulfite exporter TauE/SafE family protein [Amylibacter sp.]